MSTILPETEPVEQLFLDLPIQEVLNNDAGLQIKEPWSSLYVKAIRDGRFGDAVWARYHISGDVVNGIVSGSGGKTVLQIIREDAVEYRVNEKKEFAKAISFYAKTSSEDGHADLIEAIMNIAESNIADLKAELEQRG
ncbi:hypothetical protein N7465_002038 [Penicillium sp. CMV-2018d]|nr:hypothetical protein N7465_002038 [Penicillium sp. CMV-2018d]